MRIYKENTNDHGLARRCYASDNNAEYILTSARAKDLHSEYIDKYERNPSRQWYNRHFNFNRIK